MITKENLAEANTNLGYMDIDHYNKKTGKKVTKHYVTVAARLQAFRKICPAGTIDTTVCDMDDEHVMIQAKIYDEKDHLLASGTAEEVKNSTQINQTSFVENCETSAVGRALGMLGIGSEENMASAEEMATALMNQVELPDGKRALGTYCSEHALSMPEVCERYNVNKTAKKSDWYAVLSKVMAECGE